MSGIKLPVDVYSIRARQIPALIVVLPVALLFAASFQTESNALRAAVGFLWAFGLTPLLNQLGRDRGKLKEPWLFEQWGGKPTTRILRHRDTVLNSVTKARYHSKLSQIVPGIALPDSQRELADPQHADEVYDSCCQFLLEKTRDRSRFPILFQENVAYGFRRNLWGWRLVGIISAVIGVLGSGLLLLLRLRSKEPTPIAFPVVALGVDVLLVAIWVFLVTPEWVRLAADAFAQRLCAACDEL